MPMECVRFSTGEKGNMGKFIGRNHKICAAGIPNERADSDCFKQYLLQDEVDALVGDAIVPPSKLFRHGYFDRPDMRNAGIYNGARDVINPLCQTKFQTLVDDFKHTVYKSYWKAPLGRGRDSTPMFPAGFDVQSTTFGIKYEKSEPLSLQHITDLNNTMELKVNRKYCTPPFDPDRIYGIPSPNQDPPGPTTKCCLTDERIFEGRGQAKVTSSLLADFKETRAVRLGSVTHNDCAFGKAVQHSDESTYSCMASCRLNKDKELLLKCLGNLNTLRKCLSKRFESFNELYLKLKYYDKSKTGWLPKQTVYDVCASLHIYFNIDLLENLLQMWQCFDRSQIEYRSFVNIINYKIPSPEIPKIWDVADECIDFRTTYSEMVKPGQETDMRKRAGIPSGRYFDVDYPVTPENCCRAHRSYLPEESDAKCCLYPSILTSVGVSHRDMYAVREPKSVRRVFEACGEQFTDEKFDAIWKEASKYHSKGFVCYETFRKALETGISFKK